MTSIRLSLAALAVAGTCTIAAAWRSQLFPAAILVSVFCMGVALVLSRSSRARFWVFCLGQPVVILAGYSNLFLSPLLEAGLMTVFLHSLGQLSSVKQGIAWAATIPFLVLATGMIATSRHVLTPLAISLAIAAVAGLGFFFSSYRISHRSFGGVDEDQTL